MLDVVQLQHISHINPQLHINVVTTETSLSSYSSAIHNNSNLLLFIKPLTYISAQIFIALRHNAHLWYTYGHSHRQTELSSPYHVYIICNAARSCTSISPARLQTHKRFLNISSRNSNISSPTHSRLVLGK